MKSKTTAILLCFFLGILGIHRFYLGYTKIGIIQFLTGGGFVIWAIVDFLRLFTGSLGPEGSVWKEEAEKVEEERRIEVEKLDKEREEERRKREEERRKKEAERRKREEEEERKEAERKRRFNEMKENFYDDNNLTVLPNGNIRDENFEEYKLEEERVDFIVYMPEGMKGKRAYIKTDGENYLEWSGPIKKADKSNFLRGDFEKVKEESQPIEETTIQEKKGDKIDATDEIVSSIEKLKELLDKGILTEEEYQKKKDELVSRI